jgi:hypothetical protein
MRRVVSVVYLGVLPRLPVSSRPASRRSAYRTRHFDAVPVVQPTLRPIARVDVPSAASKTIRAPLAQTVFGLRRAHQAVKLNALRVRQIDRGRLKNAIYRNLES